MAIHIMPDRDTTGRVVAAQAGTFTAKEINGSKLFRRKHGFSSELIPAGGTSLMLLSVPYANVKINELEIANGIVGDTLDLKILDTITGAITGHPNYMLNQFGFDVYLPNGFYRDVSNYDASLFYGMQIEVAYKNNSLVPHKVYGNIIYHELV